MSKTPLTFYNKIKKKYRGKSLMEIIGNCRFKDVMSTLTYIKSMYDQDHPALDGDLPHLYRKIETVMILFELTKPQKSMTMKDFHRIIDCSQRQKRNVTRILQPWLNLYFKKKKLKSRKKVGRPLKQKENKLGGRPPDLYQYIGFPDEKDNNSNYQSKIEKKIYREIMYWWIVNSNWPVHVESMINSFQEKSLINFFLTDVKRIGEEILLLKPLDPEILEKFVELSLEKYDDIIEENKNRILSLIEKF